MLCNWACWLSPRPPHLKWTTTLQSIPHAIQKYFVTLLVGSFLNVILNLQKRETSKCRMSMAVLLDTHRQLHNTISYCSDMCPAVINRPKAWTWNAPDEGQVLCWWMQTAISIETPSQTSILFYVSLTKLRKQQLCDLQEVLHNLTVSNILIQMCFFLFTINHRFTLCLLSNDCLMPDNSLNFKVLKF